LKRRIFIAIPVPPEIPTYLEKLKEDNRSVPGIKWVKFTNLHLTIYFIGNINASDFEGILNIVRLIINTHKTIVLDFENISFAPAKDQKMIWARFYKNISFTRLVDSIHTGLNSIIPENNFSYKEPIPHITLARFHRIKKNEKIYIERPLELSQIEINACELMESIPSPEGIIYKNVAPTLYFNK
jgi:2'-5' RNA ligase